MINANNPKLTSWLPVPEGSDFPIQNLPFGIIRDPQELHTPVAVPCLPEQPAGSGMPS